ncbi:rna-directed dna polymerase from mobile element jockey-like [Limosa lapponica baueri]|uniref:Rna-directed dna polymerase from mobile element jockey-like n=1 Tax=Limosa lapponica baueri TaxID=1758121 RepID=A0A2I0TVB9_LIMLA|nr:rna-directed dna polymerase from mobile element jockey-like [Limosa lapponica baueri]
MVQSLTGSWLQVISGSIMLNIFINDQDLDNRTECTFTKFTDDIKHKRPIHELEARAAIQRDPNKLQEWANKNLVKFSMDKCKFCVWDRLNKNDHNISTLT